MKLRLDFDIRLGCLLIGFVILLMLTGLFYTPYDPEAMNISQRFSPPCFKHIMGTDKFGRDNFSRIMVGSRFTLFVAGCTVFIGAFCGVLIGLTAGYCGGAADELIMRVIDILNSFPGILMGLIMVSVLGPGEYTIIIALGILFIPSFTRVIRSETLQYKKCEFIESAQLFGAAPYRIMFLHILPNIYPVLLSSIIVGFSNAILAETSMSYLGLGIQPPTPSWGRMLFEAQADLFYAPWNAIMPGIMIMITLLGFNYLGESIRRRFC